MRNRRPVLLSACLLLFAAASSAARVYDNPLLKQGRQHAAGQVSEPLARTAEELDDYNEIDDKRFLMLGADQKHDDEDPDVPDDSFCRKNKYRKRTLKVVKEIPFVGLFPELQRTRRFEGSAITYAKGYYWVVFDSLRSLGRLDLRFSFRGPENALVGAVGDESQFEGISYVEERDTFFVLRETMQHEEHGLVPVTEELKLDKDGTNYQKLSECPIRFNVEDENKGFESLVVFERDGKLQMLGLCESNYCKTIHGDDPPGLQRGNGRLVWAVYQDNKDDNDECRWEVERVIHIPDSCYLLDYSAIAFRGSHQNGTTDVAVVSQEDAAVWVGTFNWEKMEFCESSEGRLYHFPRGDHCTKQYCNVEGVSWIDGERLVFASDKAKKTQDWRCTEKDQSVHIMALP